MMAGLDSDPHFLSDVQGFKDLTTHQFAIKNIWLSVAADTYCLHLPNR